MPYLQHTDPRLNMARPTTGGPGSAAITNDDEDTYTEPDNGYNDYVERSLPNVKDPRSY